MGCEDCEKLQQEGLVTFFRYGNDEIGYATIGIIACNKHFSLLHEKLNANIHPFSIPIPIKKRTSLCDTCVKSCKSFIPQDQCGNYTVLDNPLGCLLKQKILQLRALQITYNQLKSLIEQQIELHVKELTQL